jgi:hypothetical protein
MCEDSCVTTMHGVNEFYEHEADLPSFQIVPEKGSFIGFKKINGIIIELEIPENAKRTSSLVGGKCRAEFAKVIKVYNNEKFVSSMDSFIL